MAFTFEILHVAKFPHQRTGVLDGKLLDGKMMNEKRVKLVHGDEIFPLQIKGPVLGRRGCSSDQLIGLSVDLRQNGMTVVSEGDLLISND